MKCLIRILATLLLTCSTASAALTIDSTATGTGADPLSISRTIAVGATLDVLLCASDSGVNIVSSVARSTDNYTELRNDADGVTGVNTSIWYMINPLSGTANVVATVSGAVEGLGCWGISFLGGDTSNPFHFHTGQMDGSGADTAESLTVSAGDQPTGSIIIDILGCQSVIAGTLTAGANQTEIMGVEDTGQGHCAAGSHQNGGGDGIMSWTWTTTSSLTAYSVAVIRAAAVAGGQPIAPVILY